MEIEAHALHARRRSSEYQQQECQICSSPNVEQKKVPCKARFPIAVQHRRRYPNIPIGKHMCAVIKGDVALPG